MATRLENYLNAKYTQENIRASREIGIVGTDKDNYSPLLKLYEKLSEQSQPIYANCLSTYLIKKGYKWSRLKNLNWLQESVNIESLNTFYIAHPAINEALKSVLRRDGKVNLTNFNEHYKGKKNDSYAEVIILIFANFVNFESTQIPIGDKKFAGKLTRG